MPALSASAPGKIILFGEHAVVYGQPAIAVPVTQVEAKVILRAQPDGDDLSILAPDISLKTNLLNLPFDDAVARAIRLTLEKLGVDKMPPSTLMITSTIPLAAGLGSGAAVSVAVVRAVSTFLGHPLPDETVNQIVYEVEKIHHGTPSGIDNTVITYGKPVYFIKDQPIKSFNIGQPFMLVIGDTGVSTSTAVVVGDVRKSYEAEPGLFQNYFFACGQIAHTAYQQITRGRNTSLGPLMDDNHKILVQMGVSCPELDTLVAAAKDAGALGAKLSGGGRGGNMIALVEPGTAETVAAALRDARAVNTITTVVG